MKGSRANEHEAETPPLGREDLKFESGTLEMEVSMTWFKDGRAEGVELEGMVGMASWYVLRPALSLLVSGWAAIFASAGSGWELIL